MRNRIVSKFIREPCYNSKYENEERCKKIKRNFQAEKEWKRNKNLTPSLSPPTLNIGTSSHRLQIGVKELW